MVKIDWFAIDMDAFEEKYNAYLEAAECSFAATRQAYLCHSGQCDHDRRRKKDGTPDKRYPCPQAEYWDDQDNRTSYAVYYEHHAPLFKAIGLEYKREEVTQ